MPEFRQKLATGDWIIIAAERAKRPEEFAHVHTEGQAPMYDATCPFCRGNEAATPATILTLPLDAGAGAWEVRVVPNKFPALVPSSNPPDMLCSQMVGPYLMREGAGQHEVIIESPQHNLDLPMMDDAQIKRVVQAYHQRFMALNADPTTALAVLFRNHGARAGTSIRHPHAQIVASSIVSSRVRRKIYEGQRYFDSYNRCVYCDIIEYEVAQQQRVILENRGFIAIAPYASGNPYEIMLLPRAHHPTFGTVAQSELSDLAYCLRDLLARLWRLLGDPDYNFVIDTAPEHLSRVPFYHWHLEIYPKLTTPAGFEIGSGIGINIVPPEQAAADLLATDGSPIPPPE